MPTQNGLSPLQTVDRSLHVLSLFTPSSPELTVAQAALALSVSRSMASRLLAALEARQFVSQDQETGRFRLGVRNYDLGALFLQSHRLVIAATPYLERLGQDETLMASANLFILDDGEALRLASYPVRPLTRIRVPAHCTAAGKALLAGLSATELEQLITRHGLPARTAHTITDVVILHHHLGEIRARGYAIDAEESHFSGFCYAAPIYDVERCLVGAVSVSVTSAGAPSVEWDGRLAQSVIEAARRISESLGSGPLWQAIPVSRSYLVSRPSISEAVGKASAGELKYD
ncbi:MAG: IclR family transcriptional regulator [Thermomicrobiales bacterium]